MKRCTKTIDKLPTPGIFENYRMVISEQSFVNMYIKINEIIERLNNLDDRPKRKGK